MKEIRLLLVDDEERFRITTARVLERRGFRVDAAANGEEALAYLEKTTPDLVLLDLKMDVMDGISALEHIRKKHGDLPVIILTGHGRLDSAMAGINLGVIDFIQKPVDVEQLAITIRNLLEQKGSRPLQERSVADLMIPARSYDIVFVDQKVGEVMESLKRSLLRPILSKVTEVGHRSVIVTERDGRFRGLLRLNDILALLEPEALKDSPYSSYFTGMFLAQCKVFPVVNVEEILGDTAELCVAEDTPLMEATVLMVNNKLINLPVVKNGRLMGVLRDRDLFLEITRDIGSL